MTIKFRIDSVTVNTSNGRVHYTFSSNLTVLAGGIGVGKSTLFELIKYGLGGRALLAEVVVKYVSSVTLDLTVGENILRLSRSTSRTESNHIRVFDLVEQQKLEDHFADKREPRVSSLLLNAMDIPDDMRAASKKANSTEQGSLITFNDVFRYMYIPQGEINRHIAGSGESYYQPKRKAVFEVLFDLTDHLVLELHSTLARIRGEWENAVHDSETVKQFLTDSMIQSRSEIEADQKKAISEHTEALSEIARIRDLARPVIDKETRMLNELLVEGEKALADAQASQALLQQQYFDFTQEREALNRDIQKLSKLRVANRSIANIEFTVCPRCMQSIKNRSVPEGVCLLCTQQDPISFTSIADLSSPVYEEVQLKEQIDEIESQISYVAEAVEATTRSIADRERLIDDLSKHIQQRTRERITPQLQAYADATAQEARTTTRIDELEKTLLQWDRADDLKREASERASHMTVLKSRLDAAEVALEERRQEVFDELDEEFSLSVAEIHIPGITSAKIDRKTYLPLLNGKQFTKYSPDGGVRTAAQVAYWVTLMNVSLRRRDTHFPGFLLIDSPRTSLNAQDDLSAALYRKLVTMADAAQGRLQVIIGDNELPAAYRRDYAQIDFDYEHPTISTIKHPGPGAVETVGSPGANG
ncbi:MAG: hypothetical protein QM705_00160 [Ancrocorticia sp.]